MRTIANFHGFEITGIEELKRQLDRVGKVKKVALTRSARAGVKIPLEEAIAEAPKKTGDLRKGMKYILEKTRRNRRYKSVYRIVFHDKMAGAYVKKIKNPGLYGGKRKTAFYPISMEYGFKRKNGKRPGEFFIKNAIERNEQKIAQTVVDILTDEVNKQIGV